MGAAEGVEQMHRRSFGRVAPTRDDDCARAIEALDALGWRYSQPPCSPQRAWFKTADFEVVPVLESGSWQPEEFDDDAKFECAQTVVCERRDRPVWQNFYAGCLFCHSSNDNSSGDAETAMLQNPVTEVPAASSDAALRHFSARLEFETDCADVNAALASESPGFALIDVRGRQAFSKGHIAQAINIPGSTITGERLREFPGDTLFVVYCAGPHCNGANKAAIRLARLGRPVKEMIGGMTGWLDEGYRVAY
jgi:rhodanese-related sulfurtransferase